MKKFYVQGSPEDCKSGVFRAMIFLWGVATLLMVIALLAGGRRLMDERVKVERAEALNEEFFARGYDSGYRSAIVDAYLMEPLYMIEEDEGGGVRLWRRTELDEVNLRKIKEHPPEDGGTADEEGG